MHIRDEVFCHRMKDLWRKSKDEKPDLHLLFNERDSNNTRALNSHRDIVTVASPYFAAMLNGKFAENKENTIIIEDIAYEAAEKIINFMYSGEIDLEINNIDDLMEASSLFAMSQLLMVISLYLESDINLENCLRIWMLADRFNSFMLEEIARTYVLKNFKNLNKHELMHLGRPQFEIIVRSSFLSLDNEKDLLNFSQEWCKKNDGQNLQNSIGEMKRYESEAPILIVTGGVDNSGNPALTTECTVIRPGAGADDWCTTIPNKCIRGGCKIGGDVIPLALTRKGYAGAHTRHKFYIIGGKSKGSEKLCEEYCIRENTWQRLAQLPRPMTDAAATVCENMLFVSTENNFLGLTIIQTKREVQWRELPSPPVNRRHHRLVAAPGFVYLLGGISEVKKSSSDVFRYDVAGKVWEEIMAMLSPRAKFAAVRIGFYIFVMGGIDEKGLVSSVERYDLLKNQWCCVGHMPEARYDMAVALENGNIYCIGGRNYTNSPLPSVDRYNPKNHLWHLHSHLRIARAGCVAAMLYTPEFEPDPI